MITNLGKKIQKAASTSPWAVLMVTKSASLSTSISSLSNKLDTQSTGLYRDDGLVLLRNTAKQKTDRIQKDITEIFKNKENYHKVICKFYASINRRRGIVTKQQWFIQDSATPQNANATLELLAQKFGDRVISQKANNLWAAHSPDLNPCDTFLWGYSKDDVYAANPRTPQDLKTAITRFIRAIPAGMCKRVIGNFAIRLNKCLNCHDAHIGHIL